MRELSPQQLQFIKEYTAGKNAADAARAAGYNEEYAKRASGKLLKNPKISAAIEDARAKLRESTEYDMEAAVRELDVLIGEARTVKQYTAVSNLVQAKMKLHGLLIDRAQIMHHDVDIGAAIAAARVRIGKIQPAQIEHAPATPFPALQPVNDIFEK